jgi:Tol biopolymer transport system component
VSTPDEASVRRQLERIAQSEAFLSAPLLARFLRFTVEQTLAGETGSVKETVLGVEVCGRAKFDPRYDSVVRTTATRLRGKLNEYYTMHPGDEVRIEYPRGSYIPQFTVPVTDGAISTTATPVLATLPAGFSKWRWLVAGLAGGFALCGLVWVWMGSRGTGVTVETPSRRFEVALPPGTRSAALVTAGPSRLSPDGRMIAVSLQNLDDKRYGIWIHDLEARKWRSLSGTMEGSFFHPFWSPDSRELGFSNFQHLYKLRVDGTSAPQIVAAIPNGIGSAAWSENGTIIFSSRPELALRTVASGGGKVSPLTRLSRPQEVWHYWPVFLPGGDRFMYTAVETDRTESKVYLSSLSKSAERKLVLHAASAVAVHVMSGKEAVMAYQGDTSLMAVRFSLGQGEVIGQPVAISGPVAYDVWRAIADLSIANDGTLLTRHGSAVQMRKLLLVDDRGKVVHESKDGLYRFPYLSPDGKSIVTGIVDPRNGSESIWILDRDFGNSRRLTNGKQDNAPVWSPDGQRIAFVRGSDICVVNASGHGAVEQLTNSPSSKTSAGWTPDGRAVVYHEYIDDLQTDIFEVEAKAGAKPVPLVTTKASEADPRVSPDGRFIAYVSDESGRREIHVEPYPPDPGRRQAVQISTQGGYDPRWIRGGKELVFSASNNSTLVSTSMDTRLSSMRFQSPLWFHRGYGFDCEVKGNGFCVISAPGEDARIEPPLITMHPPWPRAGR